MAQSKFRPPPVAALVGSDIFLQLAGLAEVLGMLPPDSDRVDLDGETAELADCLDEARSLALFGGGKAVIVRNADPFVKKYREQLEEYLHGAGEGTTLVLRVTKLPSHERLYKVIQKIGRVVQCSPPKDLAGWIVERGRAAHKLAVDIAAARLLAELIGEDLGRLDNELAKLALKCDSGKATVADVEAVVAFQRERDIWDLTDALAAGDANAALRRWRQMVRLDASVEYRAVMWLGMWLEKVGRAQEMLHEGKNAFIIGQALKIWPRPQQEKFIQTAQKLGRRGRMAALDLLAEIDFQSKTGVGDARDNIERFILAMAVGAK
jgi:DNA polymerase III delta subunit